MLEFSLYKQERVLTTGWGLETCIRTQAILGKPPLAYDPFFSCLLFWISIIVFLPSILALFRCPVSLCTTAAHVFLKDGPAPAAASGIEPSPGQSERCIPLSTVIGSGLDPRLRPGQWGSFWEFYCRIVYSAGFLKLLDHTPGVSGTAFAIVREDPICEWNQCKEMRGWGFCLQHQVQVEASGLWVFQVHKPIYPFVWFPFA